MASIKLLMTSRLARVALPRTINENQLLSRCQNGLNRMSSAGICHKDRMDPVVKAIKPPPYPYKTKRYRSYRYWLPGGSTVSRFDENTVIVSIEGIPGSGKSALAKKFAEATDMRLQPKNYFDFCYIRPDGFDYRSLNSFYYKDAQYVDVDLWLKDPNHPKAGRMQCEMYKLRYFFYLENLAHILNTGQGIVTERTPWSDRVFMEAMYKCGYTNLDHERFYSRVRHNSQIKLWRPHLVIFIDTPVETALKNIKKRNNPTEVNSPVFSNTNFLKHVDESYKNRVIPEYDEHAHVLVYPYKDDFDIDAVLTEVEKMDFTSYLSSPKLCDWRIGDDAEVSEYRIRYTYCTDDYMSTLGAPTYDVDGYDYSSEAGQIQFQTERALVTPYYPGFDPNKSSIMQLAFKGEPSAWEERAMGHFKAYDH